MPISTLEPGSILSGDGGQYELLDLLGRGAYGRTFRARSLDGPFAGQLVAVKVIEFYSDRTTQQEVEATANREAAVMSQLAHPNLARLLAKDSALIRHGSVAVRVPVLVMELVDGVDLEQVVRTLYGRGLDWRVVARIGQLAAEGLAHAHEHGTLHRDVKPANIVLGYDGNVVVVDLGLAKTQYLVAQHHTRLQGTKRYWPPEVLREERLSATADVYALGLTAFELLSGGEHPSWDPDPEVYRDNLLKGHRVHSLDPAVVPSDLLNVVECAIDPDPSKRFQDARALANAFANALASVSTVGSSASALGEVATDAVALHANYSLSELDKSESLDDRELTLRAEDQETRINDAHRKTTRAAVTAELVTEVANAVPAEEFDSVIRDDLSRIARETRHQSEVRAKVQPTPRAELASSGARPAPDAAPPESHQPTDTKPTSTQPATQPGDDDYELPRRRIPRWAWLAAALVAVVVGAISATTPDETARPEPSLLPSEPSQHSAEPAAAPAAPVQADRGTTTTEEGAEPVEMPKAIQVVRPSAATEELTPPSPTATKDRPRRQLSATDKPKSRPRRPKAEVASDTPPGPGVPITIGVIPAGTVRVAGKGTVGPAPATVKLVVGSRVRVTATYKGRRKSTILVVPPYPDDLVIDLR